MAAQIKNCLMQRCILANLLKKKWVQLPVRNCSTDSEMKESGENRKFKSRAMKIYYETASARDKFMKEKNAEFEVNRQHLANMMGASLDNFDQESIDSAIQYLLPSGLFHLSARPKMLPPQMVFTKDKELKFDAEGRPFHPFFYTGLPKYYELMHVISSKAVKMDQYYISKYANMDLHQLNTDDVLMFENSNWYSKSKMSSKLSEKLNEAQYNQLIETLQCLKEHKFAHISKDFIMQFRHLMAAKEELEDIPKPLYTSEGVPYMTAVGTRKTAVANVHVYTQGTGKISINNKGINYFDLRNDREQVIFPMQFANLLGKVDVVATVSSGGLSGKSGAIRLGISKCLRSFVDEDMNKQMRIAGLLTRDYRTRERNKPGQPGARKKQMWRKR